MVVHHLGLRIPLKGGVFADVLPRWMIGALLFNGYEAVFIFFVISGFLITSNSLARWGRLNGMDVRAFYVQRATRILPGLLLLLAVLAALHLAGMPRFVIERSDQSLPGALASALGLYLNWYEGRTSWLPGNWDVLWSLSIEECFYLVFPLACLAVRRERTLILVLLLFALALPYWRLSASGTAIWREKAYLPGMSAIATGVVAALLAARGRATGRRLPSLMKVGGTFGLLAVLCFSDLLWSTLGYGNLLLLTLSTASLLIAFRWQPQVQAWPGSGWLRSFGRLSYEIYLTHMFLVWPVVASWESHGSSVRWGVLWYLPAIAGSWLAGWLVARCYSEPVARILRRRYAADVAVPVAGSAVATA